ncbi:MAG: CHAP domain-containing protein [Williamsia sp.]|nr:CHAP domain-containing protein [Williamsia sp.]MBE7178989.1 CHAP domain-containing protein [Mucilaginibacter polytrichastri]
MQFPNKVIKIGSDDDAAINAIAQGLAAKGYPSGSPAGVFDSKLKSLVKLYQSQNSDTFGRPLIADGEVGSLTWGSIFSSPGSGVPVVNVPPTGEAAAALGVAISQIGVLEQPLGSNRGPMVDDYQRVAGLTLPPGNAPGFFWCMAFVYWCFHKAGNGQTSFPRTAGCLDAWNRVKKSSTRRILTRSDALTNPSAVKPGMVFILDHGGGAGHTGFVHQSAGGALKTVEGNTNPTGSSNGLGVFELNRRKIIDPSLKGFLDFS